MRAVLVLVACLTACASAPTFSSVAAKVPESGPAGAAIAVCKIRDVYALGEEIGEAYHAAKAALEQLKALPL